jgi:hypothetical protein
VYYLPRPVSNAELGLMRRLDQLHLEHPFAGSRMLRDLLRQEGIVVGRKHVAILIRISLDGKGCWRDNVLNERLWKSVKYEEVYLKAYASVSQAGAGRTRSLSGARPIRSTSTNRCPWPRQLNRKRSTNLSVTHKFVGD